jgi:hypothetical protein
MLRIVTVKLRTRATHEYLYLLDNPKDTGTAVSEITALSPTTFLVDERNGKLPAGRVQEAVEDRRLPLSRGRRPKRPDRPVRFGTFGLPVAAHME